jgi:hypothetical protein
MGEAHLPWRLIRVSWVIGNKPDLHTSSVRDLSVPTGVGDRNEFTLSCDCAIPQITDLH